MNNKKIEGIITALLTPFDKQNKINEEVLRKHVSRCMRKGVEGFYVAGSTGEAFLLSYQERKQVLKIVVDEVNRKVPVICHIGDIATDNAIDLGRHAVSIGADAVSAIPPFYYKFSPQEILGYYCDIASQVSLPLIPYNFPALSGVTLTPDLIRELRSKANIAGVKFTSNDLFQLERMKQEFPDLVIYNGFDEIFVSGLAAGADGAIGSTYNFMPEKFIRIRLELKAGRIAEAQEIQHEANHIISALIQTGKLLTGLKYILDLQGLDFGDCRRPFLPLTDADKKLLKGISEKYLKTNNEKG